MKSILICCSLLVICSCTENSNKAGTDLTNSESSIIYQDIEQGRLNIPGYSIRVISRHNAPDSTELTSRSYLVGSFLFIYDSSQQRTDSLQLESVDDLDEVKIEELSDSLRFKKPAVLLTWSGDSDMPTHEMVAYDNDTLKTIFATTNIVSLTRKDEMTLVGFVSARDEIVAWSQDDYPVIISLKDGEIEEPVPPVQYIGASTRALENINAYRMKGRKDSSRYTIRKGTELRVDTLYRSANTVRLLTADSIIIHATPDALRGKIETNTAG